MSSAGRGREDTRPSAAPDHDDGVRSTVPARVSTNIPVASTGPARPRGPEALGAPAEADLVEEACVAKHGEPIYCSAYARGYDPSRLVNALSENDQKRVAALVASDWPRASRRLARWQVELHSGVRLDTSGGVEVQRTCRGCSSTLAPEISERCARSGRPTIHPATASYLPTAAAANTTSSGSPCSPRKHRGAEPWRLDPSDRPLYGSRIGLRSRTIRHGYSSLKRTSPWRS